jgi:hypothetical protein
LAKTNMASSSPFSFNSNEPSAPSVKSYFLLQISESLK